MSNEDNNPVQSDAMDQPEMLQTEAYLLPTSPEAKVMPLSADNMNMSADNMIDDNMIDVGQMSATEEMDTRPADTTDGMFEFETESPNSGSSTRLLLHETELPVLGPFFQFHECIGSGGFCYIRKAFDSVLQREVAIKTLREEHNAKYTKRNSFIAEAKVTATLDHPNIIPTHGLYTDEQHQLHLVIKLIEGKNLKELILDQVKAYKGRSRDEISKEESPQLILRLEIFLKVCDAIAYAHNKKILHRDIKPENIMVGQFNQVYVMDWGIAEARETSPHPYKKSVQGTLQYLAPEIATNMSYDSRSDIYSLGVLLYNLVFLKKPFPDRADTDEFYKLKLKDRPPARKHAFGVRVSKTLFHIVSKAMAVQPANRYQTVEALANDLHRFLHGNRVVDSILQKIRKFIGKMIRP
ncbi:MAG: serine/threonine-protein kinase [Thermoguttaceae bacterium]|nr:serine/threonine-protein kinase [Thermoguttaceae bacterium]